MWISLGKGLELISLAYILYADTSSGVTEILWAPRNSVRLEPRLNFASRGPPPDLTSLGSLGVVLSRDMQMGGGVVPSNIFKIARKLIKSEPCCKRNGHSVFRPVAMGWPCNPLATGCHLFATPEKFLATFPCCFIFAAEETAPKISLDINLCLCSIRVQKKVKHSSGSNFFTYNLPHYTTSM